METFLRKVTHEERKLHHSRKKGRRIVKVQEVKRKIKLNTWAAQIQSREESGLTVKQWCKEAGIDRKTYYYRLKRVREELLDTIAESDTVALVPMSAGSGNRSVLTPVEMVERTDGKGATKGLNPVFATFPMPQGNSAAVTVWLGGHSVEIQNSADGAVVEQVLKVVSRL